jgi:hypothetical protein
VQGGLAPEEINVGNQAPRPGTKFTMVTRSHRGHGRGRGDVPSHRGRRVRTPAADDAPRQEVRLSSSPEQREAVTAHDLCAPRSTPAHRAPTHRPVAADGWVAVAGGRWRPWGTAYRPTCGADRCRGATGCAGLRRRPRGTVARWRRDGHLTRPDRDAVSRLSSSRHGTDQAMLASTVSRPAGELRDCRLHVCRRVAG